MFQLCLLEDRASKHDFVYKVCQSTLELGNMGKEAVVKQTRSVRHVLNTESRKSSLAAFLLASW